MSRSDQRPVLWVLHIGHHKEWHIRTQDRQMSHPLISVLSSRGTPPETRQGMRVNAVLNLYRLYIIFIIRYYRGNGYSIRCF